MTSCFTKSCFVSLLSSSFVLLLVMNVHTPVIAQGVTRSIAKTGDADPGGNGVFERFNGAPVLNNSGQVGLVGILNSTSGGSDDNTAMYVGNSSSLDEIVRKGQAVTGGNGFYSLFAPPGKINDRGNVAFYSTIAGSSGGNLDDTGVFLGDGSIVSLIAREGALAPGGGTFESFSNVLVNESDQVSFAGYVDLDDGGVGFDEQAIFFSSGGTNRQVVRTGQTAPDGDGEFLFFAGHQFNDQGTVAFYAGLENTDSQQGIYNYIGNSLVQIARLGDTVPVGPGTYRSFGVSQLNNQDQTSFYALLNSTGSIDNDSGLFISSGNSISQLVREGQSVAGTNREIGNFGNHLLNDRGQVAFNAALRNSTNGVSEGEGIFRTSGGSIASIATSGEATPDGNGEFSSFYSGRGFSLLDGGQVGFQADVHNTVGGSSDDTGYFLSDGIDTLKVVREGDSIGAGGDLIEFFVVGDNGVNDHGQVAYYATSESGNEYVQVWTPDLHWRRNYSSSWSNSSNWTLGLNPAHVHNVFIDPEASLTVSGPTEEVTVNGLVIAGTGFDQPTSGQATLRLQRGGKINVLDNMYIEDNGTLTGDGTIVGTVTNSGGRILAQNLTVEGGLLYNYLGGTIEGNGRLDAFISNLASGSIRANNGNVLQLTGPALANHGLIEVRGGEIQVSARVTNSSGTGLITGRDAVMRFDGGVRNLGAIALTDGINDVFGDIDNTGVISIGGDAEAIFYDDIIQNGDFVVSSFGSRTSSAIVLGEFSGAGGFSGGGDLFLLGDLRPGNSPDSVLMDGNLFLGSTTLSEFEFAGEEIGEFDQLIVTGDLNLNGQLSVSLLGDFEFGFGQEFIVADVGGQLFGQFDGLDEGDLIGTYSGRQLFVSYSAGDGNDVSFFTAVPEPSGVLAGSLILIGLFGSRRYRKKSASSFRVR